MKNILFILSLLLTAGNLSDIQAGPAYPGLIKAEQPDGSTIHVRLCGDERFSYYTSADGLPLRRCADGFFRYAEIYGDSLRATGITAHDDVYRLSPAERAFASRFDRTAFSTDIRSLRAAAVRKSRMAPMRRNAAKGRRNTVLPDEQRSLAILVEFPQMSPDDEYVKFSLPNPCKLFSDMLNSEGFCHDGATGSVSDYFKASSNGLFNLQFDVYGPVELYYDISFYGQTINGEELNAWNMAYEACKALDGEVDFSRYDTDGDGVIDNVYIFYAGQSEANGGPEYTVWPHAADIEAITGKQFLFDGVRLNHYACSNEMRLMRDPDTRELTPRLQGIGSVCHEFSHVLGLPDVYDVTGSGAYTPGEWSLMDIGSYNNDSKTPPLLSSYEQYILGWLSPEKISPAAADMSIPPLSAGGKALMIPTANENEFFLLENRQQSGWDTWLPGHGMLVWHIDYNTYAWERNEVNSDPAHQRIDLVEAGGSSASPRTADPFPGTAEVTSFEPQPWSSFAEENGTPASYSITSISETAGGDVNFKLNGGTSGITATHANNMRIAVSGDIIEIRGAASPCNVSITNACGKQILRTTVTNGNFRYRIPVPGIYIVTADGERVKIQTGR